MTLAKRLVELIRSRCVLRGDFPLASGGRSDTYVDLRRLSLSADGLPMLGAMLREMTRDLDLDAVGGPESGAIPLVCAYLAQPGRTHPAGFFVRKVPKQHGLRRDIEGTLEPGMKVAILDDVITTGASALRAAEQAEQAGALVVAVLCVVDVRQGAAGRIWTKYRYQPMFTIDEVLGSASQGCLPDGGD